MPLTALQVIKECDAMKRQPGFVARDAKWLAWRALRFRELAVKVPRVRKDAEVRTPIVDWHIHRYRDKLLLARPLLKITPKRDTPTTQEAAQRMRQFLMRVHSDLTSNSTDSTFAPDDRIVDAMAGLGMGIGHVAVHPDAISRLVGSSNSFSYDAKKGFTGLPFTLEVPDPSTVYFEPDFSVVVEVGKTTVRRVLKRGDVDYADGRGFFPSSDTMRGDSSSWAKTANIYRLEDSDFCYTVVQLGSGAPYMFDPAPNIFGRPAYAFFPGHVTSSSDPLTAFEPLVGEVYPLAHHKNIYDTLRQSAALLTGSPLFWLDWAREAAMSEEDRALTGEKERPEVVIDPTKPVLDIPIGARPTPLALALGLDLIKVADQNNEEIGRMGFPVVLSLPQEIRTQAGYDRARMEEAVEMFIGKPLRNIARGWKQIFILILRAVKELDMPVTIQTLPENGTGSRELTFRPKDIIDADMSVTFKAESRASRIAWQEEGERLKAQGDIDEIGFQRDFMEHEAPEEAIRQLDFGLARQVGRDLALQKIAQAIGEGAGIAVEEAVKRVGARRGPPSRPPAGSTAPAMGATLVQPEPPKEQVLAGQEGEAI